MPYMLDFHSCAPYSIVDHTTAAYSSQELRADDPHIDVTNLTKALKTVIPLQIACTMYSFQMSLKSSHTFSTLIILFSTLT